MLVFFFPRYEVSVAPTYQNNYLALKAGHVHFRHGYLLPFLTSVDGPPYYGRKRTIQSYIPQASRHKIIYYLIHRGVYHFIAFYHHGEILRHQINNNYEFRAWWEDLYMHWWNYSFPPIRVNYLFSLYSI